YLEVSSNRITRGGVAALKGLPALKVLRLTGGGSGKFLPAVRDFPSLEKLTLQGPTGDGDAELDHLRALKNLRMLNLLGLPLTDKSLDRITGLKTLENLAVGGAGITDRGLDKLKSLPDLRFLTLYRTSV